MVRRWGRIAAFILVVAMTLPVMGQDKDADKAKAQPWAFYKMDLTVREMDGTKTLSTRTYNLTQRESYWGMLRVGNRLPITDKNGNFQYIDIGLNLDSQIQGRDDDVALNWRMEFSSVAPELSEGKPVVRSVKNDGQTLLIPGKQVQLSSIDDVNTSHRFVFELTATKVK
jgi:hypothetical protein